MEKILATYKKAKLFCLFEELWLAIISNRTPYYSRTYSICFAIYKQDVAYIINGKCSYISSYISCI